MKKQDWVALLIVPVCLFCPLKEGIPFLQAVIIRLLFLAVFLGVFALFFRWPKRYRDYRHGQTLLALPQKKVTGYIADLRSYDTGKKSYISVSDGTTMEIGGDWSIYEHSHLETYPVYEGDILSLTSVRNGKPFMKFRSLPSYVDGTEHKLRYYHNSIEVTYITDTDGTNYCLSIRPMDEEQGSSFPM